LVASLAVAVAVAGAGAAAAGDRLPMFRAERVAPVGVSATDLLALPDLRAYGEVAVAGADGLHQVPDAATAAAETGLEVALPTTLPRGISGAPVYQVGGQVSATVTFSGSRTAPTADGTALPPPPAGLEGAELRLVAGPGVAQVWSSSAGVPALLVGRAVAPSASTSGVPFEVVRDHLLSLPGVPDDLAQQLRAFSPDGPALPLPLPTERVTTSTADVLGHPATVVADRNRTMAAVVWVADGVVTVVAGSLRADEVLATARGLR
jgi:hypothetical protein